MRATRDYLPPCHTCPECGAAKPTRGWCDTCLEETDNE